jgi:hypothetical protein
VVVGFSEVKGLTMECQAQPRLVRTILRNQHSFSKAVVKITNNIVAWWPTKPIA